MDTGSTTCANGHPMGGGDTFCGTCGAALHESASREAIDVMSDGGAAEFRGGALDPPGRSRTRLVIVGVACLIAIVATAAAVATSAGRHDGDSQSAVPKNSTSTRSSTTDSPPATSVEQSLDPVPTTTVTVTTTLEPLDPKAVDACSLVTQGDADGVLPHPTAPTREQTGSDCRYDAISEVLGVRVDEAAPTLDAFLTRHPSATEVKGPWGLGLLSNTSGETDLSFLHRGLEITVSYLSNDRSDDARTGTVTAISARVLGRLDQPPPPTTTTPAGSCPSTASLRAAAFQYVAVLGTDVQSVTAARCTPEWASALVTASDGRNGLMVFASGASVRATAWAGDLDPLSQIGPCEYSQVPPEQRPSLGC